MRLAEASQNERRGGASVQGKLKYTLQIYAMYSVGQMLFREGEIPELFNHLGVWHLILGHVQGYTNAFRELPGLFLNLFFSPNILFSLEINAINKHDGLARISSLHGQRQNLSKRGTRQTYLSGERVASAEIGTKCMLRSGRQCCFCLKRCDVSLGRHMVEEWTTV